MAELVRIEHDSMGTVEVPAEVLWGAQTQRSLLNFAISGDRMPAELIHALALIKQAAASVNCRLGVLDVIQRDLIINAASAVAAGLHDNQFPLKVWQTGSGTHTNMNVNEVISNLASQASSEPLGSHRPVHPNDHVNKSQSTNDVFPTAMHMAIAIRAKGKLLPSLKILDSELIKKTKHFKNINLIFRRVFK